MGGSQLLGCPVWWHRGSSLRRRDFIKAFAGSAGALLPLAARAQRIALPVIGFLNSGSPEAYRHLVTGFHQGLKEMGYVEGENVTIEYRWANGHYDQLNEMLSDLVRRRVNVIVAATTPAALAAEASRTTIPIIFDTAGDPVRLGLVTSLNRPGRNITGISQVSSELVPKRLGLLHDLVPAVTTIALLVNANDPRSKTQIKDMQDAAHAVGLQIRVLNVSAQGEISSAFAKLPDLHADALIVGTGELFNSRPDQLAELAARQRIPAIYQAREFVAAGGLASYGSSRIDAYRQVGVYAGRVLKGERPADLPVARPTKFELVINLKTAKALGLTIPSGVIAIADEVIE